MRLINTTTGLFEEFIGTNIPNYAILSHTWEGDEVSFKDMNDRAYKNKKGFRKIEMTCQLAAGEGLQYAWIDTCCIDKSSSAELTEAINSMYRWYQRAKICYAFLSDLPEKATLSVGLLNCRWFTRGWTLQELIAPLKVYFFNRGWDMIGSKATLAPILSRITGIDIDILQTVRASLASIPIATKMSWAANRETTRIEDRAYSLLGIFDVHMPLVYGEEEQAFRRLQEEIIKTTPDLSIFGWCLPPRKDPHLDADTRFLCGILADSPTAFSGCGPLFGLLLVHNLAEFSLSNSGIKTRLQVLLQRISDKHAFSYILPLQYWDDSGHLSGVRLRKVGQDRFLREDPWTLLKYNTALPPDTSREIYLFAQLPRMVTSPYPFISLDAVMPQMRTHALKIKMPQTMQIYDAWSWGRFDDEDQLFFVSGNPDRDCAILKLAGSENVRLGTKVQKFKYQFIFFALGWSSTLAKHLECSIIDTKTYANETKEARTLIADRDYNRFQIFGVLRGQRVPKFSLVAFNVPGTKKFVLLSYTLQSNMQSSICGNPFWEVEFSTKVIERKDLPPIEHENWERT